jgi:hypothetical protein
MYSPAVSDLTNCPKSRLQNALEITIGDLLAAYRTVAGKGRRAVANAASTTAMSARKTGVSLLLALIRGCGTDARLGGRVGLFAEREGALAPVSARGP